MDSTSHIKNAIHSADQAREIAGGNAAEALIKAASWLEAALAHSPAPTGPEPKKDPPPPLDPDGAE